MIARAKPPTKAEAARLTEVGALPCLPCMIDGWPAVPATVQHVCEGRQRLGDFHTYPSCPWHHQGITSGSVAGTTTSYGPSFAHDRNSFEERYGRERQLVQMTDALLRMQVKRRDCGALVPFDEMMRTAQELHAELVLRVPPV